MSIVVTTPTGNIGSKLVHNLIRAGVRPTVIVRNAARLDPGVRDLVDVREGDQLDLGFVRQATKDAEALFWLTPPDNSAEDPVARYAEFGRVATEAVRTNEIARVVHLSSVGADRRQGVGLIDGLGQSEEALNATAANVVHLRAGFFYENFLAQADAIRHTGAVYFAAPADSEFVYVATRDIAEVAAGYLLNRNWTGRFSQGVYGPRNLTFAEAAAELSRGLGREVRHVEVSDEQAEQTLLGFGASPRTAQGYVQMFRAFREDQNLPDPRDATSTTSTSLAAWALESLAPLVQVQPATV